MSALSVVAPPDLSTLRSLLAGAATPVHFLAGGTDLLIAGCPLPDTGLLVDLSRMDGMAHIATEGADIRIRAATTVVMLADHCGLRARFPALSEAAAQCGSVQIRNRATIGGNIANASPGADLLPVLLAAGARLCLLEPGGEWNVVAILDFAPAPGRLIVEVILPNAGILPRSAFVKLGVRQDLTISRLSLALLAELQDGRFGVVRLAAGAIGPKPRRLPHAESALEGRRLEPGTLRDFLSSLVVEVDNAIAGRASQLYKRRAIAGLGLDLIARISGMNPRHELFEEALA